MKWIAWLCVAAVCSASPTKELYTTVSGGFNSSLSGHRTFDTGLAFATSFGAELNNRWRIELEGSYRDYYRAHSFHTVLDGSTVKRANRSQLASLMTNFGGGVGTIFGVRSYALLGVGVVYAQDQHHRYDMWWQEYKIPNSKATELRLNGDFSTITLHSTCAAFQGIGGIEAPLCDSFMVGVQYRCLKPLGRSLQQGAELVLRTKL